MKNSNSIALSITPERIRQFGLNARGSNFSSVEAEAFMALHHERIEEVMLDALKKFVVEKL